MNRGALTLLLCTVIGCASPAPASVPPSLTAGVSSTPSLPTETLTAPRAQPAAIGAPPSPTVAPPALPDPPTTSPSPRVRLMAVGDVSLGWEVGRKIVNRGVAAPWKGVDQYLDQADLVVANLECVISRLGKPWPTKLVHLRAPLAAAESLAAGGVDVVSVANNHALDFGAAAFADELARLDANGVEHAGGGENAKEAHDPLVVESNGLRIAFLGYVLPFSSKTSFHTRDWEAGANRAGLAIGTPESVRTDVAHAREVADVVVVMVHGGREYSSRPIDRQKAFAAAALDAGAALVLGHHPHVLQGYLRQGGQLVAYSLGNFVFARFDGAANDSAILDVTLTADGVASFDWIPVVIKRGLPRPATDAEASRILDRLPAL